MYTLMLLRVFRTGVRERDVGLQRVWQVHRDGGLPATISHHVFLGEPMREPIVGRGDDTVGNPIELKCLNSSFPSLLSYSNERKQFPVEQFEATVSRSTVPYPLLILHRVVLRVSMREPIALIFRMRN